jgi:ParB family chromosome partitioning protein
MQLSKENLMDGLFAAAPKAAAKTVVNNLISSNSVVELPLEEIRDYSRHTFRVLRSPKEEWNALVESIREIGVKTPILVRENPTDASKYECISGHRRRLASEDAGKTTIPAIVLDLDDESADMLMVISNNQRTRWLPSEKALSWKMEYDVLKAQGKRVDLDKETRGEENDGGKSAAEVRLEALSGQSIRTVQRFIHLCSLTEECFEMLDNKEIPFAVAYRMADLSESGQEVTAELIKSGQKVKPEDVDVFLQMEKDGTLNAMSALKYMNSKKLPQRLKFTSAQVKRIDAMFPESFEGGAEEKEKLIEQLLSEHFQIN